MRKTFLLAATATLCLQGAAFAQPSPIITTDLTVTGGNSLSEPGTAKVINSTNTTIVLSQGTPTPNGVYAAGNPVLAHCFAPQPCSTLRIDDLVKSQFLLLGETVSNLPSEHAFRQRFDVRTGGDEANYMKNTKGELIPPGKEGFDTSTHVYPTPTESLGPNTPNVWAMNSNLILENGARARLATGLELDLTNESGTDCSKPGETGDCHLLWLLAQGKNAITSFINLDGNSSALYGIDINNRFGRGGLASVADIRIQDTAPVGILFETKYTIPGAEQTGVAQHSTATILDKSRSPVAFFAAGDYSGPVFFARTNGTSGFESGATKTGADFFANGTGSPAALFISGRHQDGAIQDISNSLAALRASGIKDLATVHDVSRAPAAFLAEGNYSGAVFNAHTNGFTGFESSGTKSGADFFVNGTRSPIGLVINGYHGTGAILEESNSDSSGSTPVSLQTRGRKTVAAVNLLDAAPVGLRVAGTHDVGISLTGDSSLTAINMKEGQKVCWGTNACMTWTLAGGYAWSDNNGQRTARLDNAGNLYLKGQLTPGGQGL